MTDLSPDISEKKHVPLTVHHLLKQSNKFTSEEKPFSYLLAKNDYHCIKKKL